MIKMHLAVVQLVDLPLSRAALSKCSNHVPLIFTKVTINNWLKNLGVQTCSLLPTFY